MRLLATSLPVFCCLFVGDGYVVFVTRAAGDAHDMDDMGRCATESWVSAEKRRFIETSNALATGKPRWRGVRRATSKSRRPLARSHQD